MPYPVRKRKDIYGHTIINGFTYMGPFKVALPRLVLTDRGTGNLTILTTLGALDSQILTLVTFSPPPGVGENFALYGPYDGPYINRQALPSVRLFALDGALSGEFAEGEVANSPPYAASQIGDYGAWVEVADAWQPGDSFTLTPFEYMP